MTLSQFDNGYWYALELKEFASKIGIPSVSNLRKDELESVIRLFLETGEVELPIRRNLSHSGVRDTEWGLRLNLPVVNYTNDKETKDFLERESQKLAPGVKRKSGSRYRLNRWREEQLASGKRITYRSLVREFVRLIQTEKPFAQIPQVRYINFLSDFFAAEQGASRAKAIRAWKILKRLDAPKTYRSWVKHRASRAR